MFTVFAAGANNTTNGVALESTVSAGALSENDIRVLRLIIGTPVSGGNVTLYNISNAVNGASTNIAFKTTLPTYSTTNINPGLYSIDFGPRGLPLPEGGNLQIDQTMNVTAVCEYANAMNNIV